MVPSSMAATMASSRSPSQPRTSASATGQPSSSWAGAPPRDEGENMSRPAASREKNVSRRDVIEALFTKVGQSTRRRHEVPDATVKIHEVLALQALGGNPVRPEIAIVWPSRYRVRPSGAGWAHENPGHRWRRIPGAGAVSRPGRARARGVEL